MRTVAGWLLFLLPLVAQQRPGVRSDARFEVASLKPSSGVSPNGGIRPAPGGQRYVASNCPIKVMIQVAYRIKADQIVGGPEWLNRDLYDLQGKAEKPSSADELHVMLMNMLVDRLQLKFHREEREMRRYALMVDKGGPRLTPHDAANAGEPWIEQSSPKFLHVKMDATAAEMSYLAFRLGSLLDAPVVDTTNLPGGYDFTLEFTREPPPGLPEGAKLNGETVDTSGPTVFEAVKRQLGLELKAQKGPVEVIVIDHVEKPSPN